MAAVQAGATTGTWGQALPPGWEAKYDPGQRRYFYINHSTQTTTWEDPRPPYYRQLAQQQQQQQYHPHGNAYRPQPSPRPTPPQAAASHAQRSPAQPQRQHHRQGEAIPMRDLNKPVWQREVEDKYNLKVTTLVDDEEEEGSGAGSPRSQSRSPRPSKSESKKKRRPKSRETSFSQVYDDKVQRLRVMFPTADETIIKQFLIKNHNSESAAASDLQLAGFQKQDAANVQILVTRIKKDFPAAETGIIRDILHGVSNNESKARHELRSLGYQMVSGGSGSNSRSRGSNRGRTSSPQGSQPSGNSHSAHKLSPAQTESPKEISTAEKKKLKAKMAAEFPDQTSNTLDMALDVCHYDEGRARTLIQSMSTTQQAKQIVSRMGLTVDSEGRRSPSPKPSPSPAAGSSGAQASQVIFNFPETSSASSHFSSSAFASQGTSSPSVVSGSRSQAPTSRVRHTRARSPASPRPQRAAALPRQPGDGYVSANVSKPNGPDTSLAKGPDKTLLIDDYLSTTGPIPGGANGPDKKNHKGPSGAQGPDSEEYLPSKGADKSLPTGPDESLTFGRTVPRDGPDISIVSGPDHFLVNGPEPRLVSGPTSCQQEAAWENTAANERGGVCAGILQSLCRPSTTV